MFFLFQPSGDTSIDDSSLALSESTQPLTSSINDTTSATPPMVDSTLDTSSDLVNDKTSNESPSIEETAPVDGTDNTSQNTPDNHSINKIDNIDTAIVEPDVVEPTVDAVPETTSTSNSTVQEQPTIDSVNDKSIPVDVQNNEELSTQEG